MAILPFSNLTGDPGLDWIVSAGPNILAEELAGGTHVYPLRATSVGTAALQGATQLLHCTFSQHGGAFQFSYALEDAESHRMTATGSLEGTILFAANTLALKLDAGALPFSTPNPAAVEAWGRGEFERAVTLDPDFGTAWLSWIGQTARDGKPEAAAVLAERALARASLRSPLNKAQIQLNAALLHKDETGRIAALKELARLAPRDAGAFMGLAEIEQRHRRYSAAIELYKHVLDLEPVNAAALNSLGYAQGENGDLESAKKTFESYGQLPGQANNALDSLGEVHFMNGKFAEAEKYFAQLSAREPNFLNSAPMMKAAYAHWLAGDLAGADALMQKYLDLRSKQSDTSVAWREGVWLYATGRREQALAALAKVPPSQAANMDRQRAIWRAPTQPSQDINQLKALVENANPAADGLQRTLYAEALVRAGRNDDARAALKLWPLPESAIDPLLQSLLYPRYLELRKTLGIQ